MDLSFVFFFFLIISYNGIKYCFEVLTCSSVHAIISNIPMLPFVGSGVLIMEEGYRWSGINHSKVSLCIGEVLYTLRWRGEGEVMRDKV